MSAQQRQQRFVWSQLLLIVFSLVTITTRVVLQGNAFQTGISFDCQKWNDRRTSRSSTTRWNVVLSSHSDEGDFYADKGEWSVQQQKRHGTNKPGDRRTPLNRNSHFDSPSERSNHHESKITNDDAKLVKTFKEDFRGTRVFVQGIPDGVSWQTLKDHFRIAGEVVFASVSMDRETGVSKGSGIVQFETTEMAQNAISIMRNHTLEGSTLFVRRDVQESSSIPSNQHFQSKSKRILWRCANDENALLLSDKDRLDLETLIRSRDAARKRKDFTRSDSIREELMTKYGVHVDDRLKLWWTSEETEHGVIPVPHRIIEEKGMDGRWGDLKAWRQIPTTPENDACVDPNLVNGLLKQRDIARKEKDFSSADSLLEEARTCSNEDGLYLRIHDESRTWRVWTKDPPLFIRKDIEQPPTKKSAEEQCLELITKYDHDKLRDVKALLTKFQGREWNILKKLKERYVKINK